MKRKARAHVPSPFERNHLWKIINRSQPPLKLWNRHISCAAHHTLSSFSFFMVVTILSKYLTGIGITIALVASSSVCFR
jgi:hypothetical protein